MTETIGSKVITLGQKLHDLEIQKAFFDNDKGKETELQYMTVGFLDDDYMPIIKCSLSINTELRKEIRENVLRCYSRDLVLEISQTRQELENLLLKTSQSQDSPALNGGTQ